MDTKKIAEKVFKAVKAEITDRKKSHKLIMGAWIDHGEWWDKGVWCWYIDVCGKRVVYEKGENPEYTYKQIGAELMRLLDEQKKVKGWGNLVYTTEDYQYGEFAYYRQHYTFVTDVRLPENPCKEFKSLQTYLKKYGNCFLPDFKLYSVHMGGKRGVLWGEEGDRHYLANKPNKCTQVLESLRKYRGTKDTITCKFGHENYMDEMERRYSEYAEIECDGEGREYVEIIIKTPQGKVKYTDKIY